MRIEVSKEQLQKLVDINEAMRGTCKYSRYQMYAEAKNSSNRWFGLGWSVPRVEEGSYIKKVGEYFYLMQKQGFVEYENRYTINKEVAGLFGWDNEIKRIWGEEEGKAYFADILG